MAGQQHGLESQSTEEVQPVNSSRQSEKEQRPSVNSLRLLQTNEL